MFHAFARPKPCSVLTTLRDAETQWHLSKLAKSSDTTYVYVTKLVASLEKAGFVTVESKGKKRIVRLTDKGMKAAKAIDELKNALEA
ncbi:MAG: hypothetical protein AB1324_07415 [Candidatus Micrarchaeota archaeon]